MAEITDHRAAILGSIRRALGAASLKDTIAAEYAAIPRTYAKSGDMDRVALLAHFEERLLEYDAGVYRAAKGGVAAAVAEILTVRKKPGLALPEGVPAEWLPAEFDFAVTGTDALELDKTPGVLTGCTVAIAETGSIVLQNAAAQGARILSLVPDYHLCVVFAEQVVLTVPEAFARLAATSSLPTTFVSGPSATADIEMTRIKGVHGPRFLDVLIVEDST
jgi:L-lactate dehydrogenase complex protein LldG